MHIRRRLMMPMAGRRTLKTLVGVRQNLQMMPRRRLALAVLLVILRHLVKKSLEQWGHYSRQKLFS